MNKKTKGAIAAGAAALLLAGGAGTFAAWNDTETLSGGTITAGQLKFVGDTAAGTWTNDADETIDISTYRIVPGETLTYTASPTIIAEGDNLEATITATLGNVSGDLAPHVNVGTVEISGAGVTNGVITAGSSNQTLDVSVPVTFDDVTGLTGQGAEAALDGITLNLTQTS